MGPEQISRRFVVELPDEGLDVAELTARARASNLGAARLLRTVYVPEDGCCFLLVEATSRQAAAAAARALVSTAARVTTTVTLPHAASDQRGTG